MNYQLSLLTSITDANVLCISVLQMVAKQLVLNTTPNRRLAGERVVNGNVIGMLERFKIIANKYQNRRKRFGLRFNLIAGIYNLELK